MKKLNISLMTLLSFAWLFQVSGNTLRDGVSGSTKGKTAGNNETIVSGTLAKGITPVSSSSNITSNRKSYVDDQQFVNQAASIGMMEVKLAQWAQKKGQSESVRNFAAMLIKDHTKSNARLRA